MSTPEEAESDGAGPNQGAGGRPREVLTVAVLAIVLTAPLGAFAIDLSYKKLLSL